MGFQFLSGFFETGEQVLRQIRHDSAAELVVFQHEFLEVGLFHDE